MMFDFPECALPQQEKGVQGEFVLSHLTNIGMLCSSAQDI